MLPVLGCGNNEGRDAGRDGHGTECIIEKEGFQSTGSIGGDGPVVRRKKLRESMCEKRRG